MNKLIASAFLIVTTSIFLSSCGSSDTSGMNTATFSGSGFTMEVPKSWIAVDNEALPTVKDGSIAAAFTSTDIASGFANNLTILRDTLSEKITSKKYSVVNYALTTGEYKDFVKLSESSVEFAADKDESNLYVFEAKYNTQTPKQKFLQTAKVCGNSVYLITMGLNLSIGSTSKYEDLVKTFTCGK